MDLVFPYKCHYCAQEVSGYVAQHYCLACERVQPLGVKYQSLGATELVGHLFEVFGWRPHFVLQHLELNQRYIKISSYVHPDRYVQKSSLEQETSLERVALVNHYYQTLKNPSLRTSALLKTIVEKKSKAYAMPLSIEWFEMQDADVSLDDLKVFYAKVCTQRNNASHQMLAEQEKFDIQSQHVHWPDVSLLSILSVMKEHQGYFKTCDALAQDILRRIEKSCK